MMSIAIHALDHAARFKNRQLCISLHRIIDMSTYARSSSRHTFAKLRFKNVAYWIHMEIRGRNKELNKVLGHS